MIYDGYLFFGAEASYVASRQPYANRKPLWKEKLQATTHRMPKSVLKDQARGHL